MKDAELVKALNGLGIDADSHRVLALLPLVQVAWADGAVQPAEAELIRKLARDRWMIGPAAEHLLEDWLKFEPTAEFHLRGRRLLQEVVRRTRGEMTLDARTSEDVVALAQAVAGVAGGLFGMMAVSATEREAIREIAAALSVDEGAKWAEAFDDLEEIQEETDDPKTDAMNGDQMLEIRAAMRTQQLPPLPEEDDDRPNVAGGVATVILVGGEGRWPVVSGMAGIGRSSRNEIPVPGDSRVSRFHAVIAVQDERFWVQDLGSENGTWVDAARCSKRRLFGGEEIVVGGTSFLFELAQG